MGHLTKYLLASFKPCMWHTGGVTDCGHCSEFFILFLLWRQTMFAKHMQNVTCDWRTPFLTQYARELIGTWKMSQTQQQRPESPMVTFAWHVSKYKVHKLHQRYILSFFWTDWHLKNQLNVCWPFTHFIHLLEVCSAKGNANCRTDRKKQQNDLAHCKHSEALCPLFERDLEIIGADLWHPVLKVRVQLVSGHVSHGFGLEPNKDLIRTCKDQYLIL